MKRNCMSKALRFLQITAEHQSCLNISIKLLQISLKLHEHQSGYWTKKLLWTILEEQFPVPRKTAASKIGNGVTSLLWQLRYHCNPAQTNFYLYQIQLWWQFFQISVYGDIVNTQTWDELIVKNSIVMYVPWIICFFFFQLPRI